MSVVLPGAGHLANLGHPVVDEPDADSRDHQGPGFRVARQVDREIMNAVTSRRGQDESLAKHFLITCWAGRSRNVSRSDSNGRGSARLASKLTSHQ